MDILVAVIVIPLLAFGPMLIYALILWWFDRYEKEPPLLMLAAFAWGAIPAIIFSLIAQLVFDVPLYEWVPYAAEFVGASLIAPLTEEPFKGLALLLLLLFFRRELDSPLDGILYGGLAGFGFAATENLFYFFSQFSEGGMAAVLELSFFRAVLFGLNHALFTGCTGLGIALARTSPRWWVKIGAPILGLGAAIVLHAVHNTGASLAGTLCWPLLISLVVDWGAVAVLVGIMVWSSVREQKWLTRYLADEVKTGAISQQDYGVIQSYWRRLGQRLRVLLSGDVGRWWYLGKYYRLASELAFVKQRLAAFGQEQDTSQRIEQLRRELYELRKRL